MPGPKLYLVDGGNPASHTKCVDDPTIRLPAIAAVSGALCKRPPARSVRGRGAPPLKKPAAPSYKGNLRRAHERSGIQAAKSWLIDAKLSAVRRSYLQCLLASGG